MERLVQSNFVQIVDRHRQCVVDAEIVDDLSQVELEAADLTWGEFRHALLGQEKLPENSDWQWAQKRMIAGPGEYRVLGLRFDLEIQGLVMVNLNPVPSRRTGSWGEPTLYVEYIETAPWNQVAFAGNSRRFDRVGMALLVVSIRVSAEAGCEGRLALHSLAQSEGFYQRVLEDLGIDPVENLRYFELGAEKSRLLSGGTA